MSTTPEPPNAFPTLTYFGNKIQVQYNGTTIAEGKYPDRKPEVHEETENGKLTERIHFFAPIRLHVKTSGEAFASETLGPAQERFRVVRNSDGPSHNLRNNAIYDRKFDWMLEGPGDLTYIEPKTKTEFEITTSDLVFRPRYYQRHKNITFFEPWKKPVRRDSVTGWCSWWAYYGDIDEKTVFEAARIFSEKLKPFGYRFIQIDDGYQSGEGAPPTHWLKTNAKFPDGLDGLAKGIRERGMVPALWVGSQVSDLPTTLAHPDWFVRDADGKAHKGPWIGYGVDGSNPAGLDAMYHPTFAAFKKAGFEYVKIDSLRHLLYDALYPCKPQMLAEGTTPELAFRKYLDVARQELGPETYILACWGVLPEAVGIADACRLGGDGFGPSTMLQYNSWNNVVWRNDPDHVDITPSGEEIIRPTLVSMAGAQFLLSDKVELYRDDRKLEGAKRASPIPFTMPGQLYDVDPSKSDNLIKGLRNQNGGSNAGPIDADQHGPECQWWQLDVSRPFENWTILTRLSWSALPEATVKFSDLGLPDGEYCVYEFWTKKYLGTFRGSFPARAQNPKEALVYSIRRTLSHPQIISTSRHITQGGPDLESVSWDSGARALTGRSQVVGGDPYRVSFRVPAGWQVKSATFDGHPVTVNSADELGWFEGNSSDSKSARWKVEFERL